MPLIFNVAIKPTSSIITGKKVDVDKLEEVEISIGRHDHIVQRAVPVVEAVTAITILDFIIERKVKELSDKLRNR